MRIQPRRLGDYLEVITRAVFQAGLNWRIIEAKWDGFRRAFHEFDVERVASLAPPEIEAICSDRAVVRNRAKVEATVGNAQKLIELDRAHHGFQSYLRSHADYWALEKALTKEFKFLGSMGAFYTLYVVGEPVPDYHEWRTARPAQARRSKP